MSNLVASRELLPLSAVETIFERLVAQLGDKVARLYGNANPETVKQEWAAGLAGFRGRELNRGLQALRTREFVPTLGEFAKLCRPALDPEYAWHEAAAGLHARDQGEQGYWTHPAVWRAACAMSPEVRSGNYTAVRKRWEWTLGRELSAGWGEEVPQTPPRIENKPTLRDIPSDVRSRLSELSKSFTRKES